MSGNYNPRKRLYRIWNKCKNPLELIISYEDRKGRYILTDPTKTFGRIIDPGGETIYCSTYVLNIFKNTEHWYKYEGSQDLLPELIGRIKHIWDNDRESRDFNIEEYVNK